MAEPWWDTPIGEIALPWVWWLVAGVIVGIIALWIYDDY